MAGPPVLDPSFQKPATTVVAPDYQPIGETPQIDPAFKPSGAKFDPSFAKPKQPPVQPAQAAGVDLSKLPRLPRNDPDINTMTDQTAAKYNLNRRAFETILQLESGGAGPSAHLTSSKGAMGAAQIMPGTWAGYGPKGVDPYDPKYNIDTAGRIYRDLLARYNGDPVKAAGAYNWGEGNIDKYLAGKATPPPETMRYMAYVAASQLPEHETPLPPHMTVPRKATQKGKNMQADKAAHNIFQEIAGHQEIMWDLSNVYDMDRVTGGKNHYMDDMWSRYKRDPAEAMDLYGLNSPNVLQFWKEKGNPDMKAYAEYRLNHPVFTAGETAFAEFFNPVSWVEGGVVGRTLGHLAAPLVERLAATKAGIAAIAAAKNVAEKTGVDEFARRVATWTSPYREIAAKFGFKARNDLHTMTQAIKHRDGDAAAQTLAMMGGQSLARQIEIVRRSQGLTIDGLAAVAAQTKDPKVLKVIDQIRKDTADPKINAMLTQRSQEYRTAITKMTDEQLKAGSLTKRQVFDKEGGTYSPMGGRQYHYNEYDPDTMGIIDQLNGRVMRGGGSVAKHKVFNNLDESLAGGLNLDKYLPADSLYHYLRARGGNVEFEQGLKSLAGRYPDMIRVRGLKEVEPPLDRWGRQMIKAQNVFGNIDSPFLRRTWISPELTDHLNQAVRNPTKVGSQLVKYSDDPRMGALGQVYGKYNSMMRGTILYNPQYHPFWNIATNSIAAARAGIGTAMSRYIKSIANTAATTPELVKAMGLEGFGTKLGNVRDVIQARFTVGAAQLQQDLAAAEKAGAMAEFGPGPSVMGGSSMRVRTLPNEDLTKMEQFDKRATALVDYNRTATFGKRGEAGQAAWLYKKFVDPNGMYAMRPEDAAWSVREALGNYNNVDRESWPSKLMFFYPWLKSNVAFWLKTFVQAPRYVNAPEDAIRRYNELSGDPRAYDPLHPRAGTSIYLGRDKEGYDTSLTLPLPWMVAERVATVLDPRGAIPGLDQHLGYGPDQEEREGAALQIVQGRVLPVAGFVANVIQTMRGPAARPGSFQGYETVYNKSATGPEKAAQMAQSAFRELFPLPVPFLTRDMLESGWRSDQIPHYLVELAGAGYITRSESDSLKKAHAIALFHLNQAVKKATAALYGPNPMSKEKYIETIQRANDTFNRANKNIETHLQKRTGVPTKEAIPLDPSFGKKPELDPSFQKK